MKARRILREIQHHALGFDALPTPDAPGILTPDRPNVGRFVRFVDGAYLQR